MSPHARFLAHRRFGCALAITMVIALAGCGGSSADEQPAVGKNGCASNVSALRQPTTQLTYLARGGLDRVYPVLCQRLAALDIAYRVRRAGADRVVIEVPGALPAPVSVPDVESVAHPGRLSFYDWEVNVIGPEGKPAPDDASVTGGRAAGDPALALSHYDAVLRAKARPAKDEPDNARTTSRFYAVDKTARKVYGPGDETRAAALSRVPATRRLKATVYEVKPNTLVLRAGKSATGERSDRYFVLQDDVALSGSEIKNPEQRFAQRPGGSGEPIVTFEFTDQGSKIWRDLTRAIAERGQDNLGVLPGQSAADVSQHFTIVLDDDIVSTPFIDFRQNPDGIDGSTGSQIEGGFTTKSAQQLAAVLRTGALTVPLELIASRGP